MPHEDDKLLIKKGEYKLPVNQKRMCNILLIDKWYNVCVYVLQHNLTTKTSAQIPLWLELFHDVEKLVVYAGIIRKSDFDLVQIWQGIFNLKQKDREKQIINAAQSTISLTWTVC